MKDVAQAAGVSLGTVSNVINHPAIVAEGTRNRVRQAIKDLGFVVNASAQTLRAGRTKVLGLVVPDIGNPFFTEVAKGVDDAAFAAGYSVILCNTDEDSAKEDRYLELLASQRVAGILITPARETHAAMTRLTSREVAITLLDRSSTGLDACSVAVDDAAGAGMAINHLFLLGHRHIVVLLGPDDIPQIAERKRGVNAAAAGKLEGGSLRFVTAPHMTTAAGEATMTNFLKEHKGSFTGLFCANDLLALGAIRALRTASLSVPKDVSVVGYDDIDFAASAQIPLTSIRQPKYQLGHAATELLIGECEDPASHAHQRVMFQPQLIIRESTKAVRKPRK